MLPEPTDRPGGISQGQEKAEPQPNELALMNSSSSFLRESLA
jgi:hypothetical protein